MKLSKTEIKVLEQIAKGNKTIDGIAKALRKSNKQIYVAVKKLNEKRFIKLKRGSLEANKLIHVTLLLQILSEHPNIEPVLSGSGICILTALLQPLTIKEIMDQTGIKRSMIYRKLKEAKKRNIVTKTNSRFKLNERIWNKLKEFLEEFMKFEQIIDDRIPANSIIYYKSDKEIVFSCSDELNITKTAFSAYNQYGIKLMLTTNYYCLPQKKLNKKDVFKHSLYVVENNKTIRNIIFVALFYLKFKKELKVKHHIITNIKRVLSKEKVEGYPSYAEIKERAEVYGIKA